MTSRSLFRNFMDSFICFLICFKRHAIKDGPEFHFSEDGSYNFGLLEKAQLVTDLKDSKICPHL
jgi:hypothetical protein